MNWQPIGTAPGDTLIEVQSGGGEQFRAVRADSDPLFTRAVGVGGWARQYGPATYRMLKGAPTHWRPA